MTEYKDAYGSLRSELKKVYKERVTSVHTPNQIIALLIPVIEKYTLPRPLFEDGEPLSFRGEHDIGTVEWALDLSCYSLGYDLGDTDRYGYYPREPWERVKRPEPVVLDANGVPIRVRDTVYTADGMEWHVDRIDGTTVHVIAAGSKTSNVFTFPNDGISPFTHVAPDTQDRINEDTKLDARNYCWKYGCEVADTRYGSDYEYAMTMHLLKRQRELLEG